MDAPLGRAVGNALEVIECIEVLKGGGPPDLVDVSVELTARMLVLGQRRRRSRPTPSSACAAAIASGAGLERLPPHHRGRRAAIRAWSTTPARLPAAPDRHVVRRDAMPAIVTRVDAELVGRASVALGAGRDASRIAVDPAVGIMVTREARRRVVRGRRAGARNCTYREQCAARAALARCAELRGRQSATRRRAAAAARSSARSR